MLHLLILNHRIVVHFYIVVNKIFNCCSYNIPPITPGYINPKKLTKLINKVYPSKTTAINIIATARISNQHRNSDADKWKSDCFSLITIRFYIKAAGLSFISIGILMLVWNSGCKNSNLIRKYYFMRNYLNIIPFIFTLF